jgi:hypothetical protein
MTDSQPDFVRSGAQSSTTLLFQAPPAGPDTDVDEPIEPAVRNDRPSRSGPDAGRETSLRMLKGARDAARGMKISDDQIRSVLEDPQDVQPDPTRPDRTRLRRDGLVVTTGNDGMILRVARK